VVGGGVAAPSSAGDAAAGGDDPAGRGNNADRSRMGGSGVDGGVAASSPFGAQAAGDEDPAGRGHGNGCVTHTRLEPLPGGSMPEVRMGVDPPAGSFTFFLEARAAITDNDEFLSLRDNMAEHVFSNRGAYLAPYL